MGGGTPLGRYAPVVAAVASIAILGGFVVAVLGGLPAESLNRLEPLALLVVGAVFGSAVTVNGWKIPTAAAHARLDRMDEAIATISAQADGVDAGTVAGILSPAAPSSTTPLP
jgi:hypothetical protein